jgi:serine/threonine protein kinase
MIGKTVSHYTILEQLGGGGMGVVYKATDTQLRRTVALKFLPPDLTRDPEARERFIHEAQAASVLEHANICSVHEIGEHNGQTFIVMGYYEGETLKKRIERGPLPIDEVVNISVQVAQGLSEAHEAGIIHRDIKPANISLTKDGTAKILGFGLAKVSWRTLFTKSGTMLGTAAYMSRE